ncbi:MAG: phosphoribosylaminoimidazolesuccinocarboxamide synthase, partial [Undibacterium sp.]|nr:phosphoribosylaminoimidazolesuccinocarboxamide synthase [Undibacterium sp.]
MAGILETNLKSLPFLHRGKVRDIYAVGDDKLLVIQTDRLSAFDVILDDPIPNKGKILTSLSNFWFAKYADLMPTHTTDIDPVSLVSPEEREQVEGRAIVVKKLTPL